MSIYIPGIAPPENCDKCTHPTCTLWQNREPDGRHKDCPIIELPHHGRLIDADAFADKYISEIPYGIYALKDKRNVPAFVSQMIALLRDVAEADTIIPAEGGADNDQR